MPVGAGSPRPPGACGCGRYGEPVPYRRSYILRYPPKFALTATGGGSKPPPYRHIEQTLALTAAPRPKVPGGYDKRFIQHLSA